MISDRIEAGTFAIAAAATGGNVLLERRARLPDLGALIDCLQKAGVMASIVEAKWHPHPPRRRARSRPSNVETHPAPRLPDRPAGPVHGPDVHRRRHQHHQQNDLREPLHARAGAPPASAPTSRCVASEAIVQGVNRLKAYSVMATDLRASAGLVIAALGRRRARPRQDPHLPPRPRLRTP